MNTRLTPSSGAFGAALHHKSNSSGRDWLAALVGVVALAALSSQAEASGRIAYISDETGDFSIYVMEADGSNITRLTGSSRTDAEPYWSYDGSRIVFASGLGGDSDIYVMDADGSNGRKLTSTYAQEGGPVFSHACAQLPQPCTEWIAFDSTRAGDWNIFMMRDDGSMVTQLTQDTGYDW